MRQKRGQNNEGSFVCIFHVIPFCHAFTTTRTTPSPHRTHTMLKGRILLLLVALSTIGRCAFPPCSECEDFEIEYPSDASAPNPLQAYYNATELVLQASFQEIVQINNTSYYQFLFLQDYRNTRKDNVCILLSGLVSLTRTCQKLMCLHPFPRTRSTPISLHALSFPHSPSLPLYSYAPTHYHRQL